MYESGCQEIASKIEILKDKVSAYESKYRKKMYNAEELDRNTNRNRAQRQSREKAEVIKRVIKKKYEEEQKYL